MSIFAYGFAFILTVAGIYHFVNPQVYYPLMPDWFPKPAANVAGGIAEIVIGITMLVPATRLYGLYAAAGLMVIFLPLHLIDLFRDRPVLFNKTAAAVRLFLQFVLIAWLVWEARTLAAGPQVQ